jgi:ubiquinone biosynthesis protein
MLTADMQEVLTSVFTGLAFKDADAVALAIYRAGATSERVDMRAFRGEIERMMSKYEGASLSRLSERGSLVEFVQLASRYRILLPREYAVLARATSIVDGIGKRLLPDADIVSEVKPWAERLVTRRFGADRVGADAVRALHHAHLALRDLPTQASQLLVDLERGRVVITTKDPDAAALQHTIRQVGGRLATAVVVAGWLVAWALLLAKWSPVLSGVPIVPLAAVGAGAASMLMVMGWWVFGPSARTDRSGGGLLGKVMAFVRFFRPPRRDD